MAAPPRSKAKRDGRSRISALGASGAFLVSLLITAAGPAGAAPRKEAPGLDRDRAERLSETANTLYVEVMAAQARAAPGALDHGCYAYLAHWTAVLTIEVASLPPLIALRDAVRPVAPPPKVATIMHDAREKTRDLARLVGEQALRASDRCEAIPGAQSLAGGLLELSRTVEASM